MYSEIEDSEQKGPYYVPWKKSSMDLYKKYEGKTLYKRKRYIPGSTMGNVDQKDHNLNDNKNIDSQ
jgi:hypothetical protein